MTTGQLIKKNPPTPSSAESLAPMRAAGATGNAGSTNSTSHLRHPATVVVLLANLRPAHWAWGWNRIAFSRWLPDRTPGLRFMKTLGSGRGGGFGLVPSPSHQGLFCLFDGDEPASEFIARSSLIHRYRQSSDDCLLLSLRPSSSRGSWDGMAIAGGPAIAPGLPLAALTRASIRPRAAAAFWRHAPPAQAGLQEAPGCELAIGLGEAPLLRQATFSLWRDAEAMDAYARAGAHQQAIRAAWQQQFFSESMFVRFAPLSVQGRWQGRDYG